MNLSQQTLKVGSPNRIPRFSSPHSSRSSSSKSKSRGRFIPTAISPRLCTDKPNENNLDKDPQSSLYTQLLYNSISNERENSLLKMLKFNETNPPTSSTNPPILSFPPPNASPMRKIPKTPYKKLDAPDLTDDFYLNLLDWSSLNTIAIGLIDKLYTFSPYNNKTTLLNPKNPPEQSICSVSFSQNGYHLASGNNFGDITLFDLTKGKPLQEFQAHTMRIGSLAWNGNLLASGSRDKRILLWDMRVQKWQGPLAKILTHKQEICGLKWSFDEKLLASGGNDNKIGLWSFEKATELARFSSHTAAVKALCWSPHQNQLLISGGGTSDRTLRFWNCNTLQEIHCFDTGSQVCNLFFSKNSNEFVSTHGYSLNQINVWKKPGVRLEKLASLTGHGMRVLYLAGSPCGENVVTGAGDETLMFWNVFPPAGGKRGEFGGEKMVIR